MSRVRNSRRRKKRGNRHSLHRVGSDKLHEITSAGGKALHEKGLAHKWTGGPEGTAAEAGRKGRKTRRRKLSRKKLSEIGRAGYEASIKHFSREKLLSAARAGGLARKNKLQAEKDSETPKGAEGIFVQVS